MLIKGSLLKQQFLKIIFHRSLSRLEGKIMPTAVDVLDRIKTERKAKFALKKLNPTELPCTDAKL